MTIQELFQEYLSQYSPDKIEQEVQDERALYLQRYDQAKEAAECALKAYPMHFNNPEIYPNQNLIISACISGFLSGLGCGYDLSANTLELFLKKIGGSEQ